MVLKARSTRRCRDSAREWPTTISLHSSATMAQLWIELDTTAVSYLGLRVDGVSAPCEARAIPVSALGEPTTLFDCQVLCRHGGRSKGAK